MCVCNDTKGIKDFVFVHFNAFKSLMDRDMGVRGGVRHKRGPERGTVWVRELEGRRKELELGYRRGTSSGKQFRKGRKQRDGRLASDLIH